MTVIDDPLGQRGKVMRIQWLPGDNFRIAPSSGRETFVSNNSAFNYNAGDKVSYAWGYMTDSTYIGATLAQNITGGDPIWMIQGRDNGELDIVPGLVRLPVRLQAKRWHDFRVDVGLPARQRRPRSRCTSTARRSTAAGAACPSAPRSLGRRDLPDRLRPDGQRQRHARTVYFSNLSCGRR